MIGRQASFRQATWRAGVLATVLLAFAFAVPALGQNVDIDLGVLDNLGDKPPPTKKPAAKKAPEKPKSAALPKAAPVPPAPKFAEPAGPPPSARRAAPASVEPAVPPAEDFVARQPPAPADKAGAAPTPPTAPTPSADAARRPGAAAGGSQAMIPAPPYAPAPPVPPPAKPLAGEAAARIVFPGQAAELTSAGKGELDALVPRLAGDDRLRVEILGYASPGSDASQARRLSLSRALAVRTYLVANGIKTSRVDVRALGSRPEGEPADRVDLLLAQR
jgi:outer membrane protein OmpA-like peptidoglycan-associated protein